MNSTDYANLGGTATFNAGEATTDRIVRPLNDALVEVPETVIVTLTDGANYDLGGTTSATVTITDQPAPIVTITAIDPAASETGPDPGVFRFTRVGNTALALTVTYTRAGSASTSDFASIGTSIVFPAGSATVDRVVTPVTDALVEGNETVIVTLTDGAHYNLESPASSTATVVITD